MTHKNKPGPAKRILPPGFMPTIRNPRDVNLPDTLAFLEAGIDICLGRNLRSEIAQERSGRIASRQTLVAELRAREFRVHESTFDRRWASKADYSRDLAAFAMSYGWVDDVLVHMIASLRAQVPNLAAGEITLSEVIDDASIANIRRRVRIERSVRNLSSLLPYSANLTEAAKIEQWRRCRHEETWLPVYEELARAAKVSVSQNSLREFANFAANNAEAYARDAYLAQVSTSYSVDLAPYFGERLAKAIKSWVQHQFNVGPLGLGRA